MKMDINAIIEKMETGDQDAALTSLQTFNKEVHIRYNQGCYYVMHVIMCLFCAYSIFFV